ncbi:LytR C-terminal domain-containing protein [Candidatus Gottesmanbacteria bacterium]|nr:LytR C-terminal domain-containing protein [Candidatus Gottesmanbacteria bacterium]
MRKKRGAEFFRICRLILVAATFFLVLILVVKLTTGGKWDGMRRFTVIIDGNPLFLFSLEPSTHQAILVTIPVNTILDVPYGYNTYPAGAVYELGNLDPKRGGGKLLSKSIENTFGIVVGGFFARGDSDKYLLPTELDKVLDLKRKYFSFRRLLPSIFSIQSGIKNVKTDLNLADIVRFWNAVRYLRSDNIKIVDLVNSHALIKEKLPDGSIVYKTDPDLLDQFFSPSFQDQVVRLQNVSVEVINATDREKVASQFSRILHNLGANVVSKSTAVQKENGNCRVVTFRHELSSSIIVDRLKKFYKCSVEESNETDVSDIKVILGQEYLQ